MIDVSKLYDTAKKKVGWAVGAAATVIATATAYWENISPIIDQIKAMF